VDTLLENEILEELFSFANLQTILSFAPAVMIITLPYTVVKLDTQETGEQQRHQLST
jgi:hypothetical protein